MSTIVCVDKFPVCECCVDNKCKACLSFVKPPFVEIDCKHFVRICGSCINRCIFFFPSFIDFVIFVEVRQEAVQQALAQAMQNRHKPSMPMPSKRTSVMARSPDRERHDSGLIYKNYYNFFQCYC